MFALVIVTVVLALSAIAFFGKKAFESQRCPNFFWISVIAWILSSLALWGLFGFADGMMSVSRGAATVFIVFTAQALALVVPCGIIYSLVRDNSPVLKMVVLVIPLTLLSLLIFGVSDVALSCMVFSRC